MKFEKIAKREEHYRNESKDRGQEYIYFRDVEFQPRNGLLYLIKENYAETINESCKEHSGEVMYALAAPIEIPLSAADIAAYRALITYGPTTIVETDGAGIKLDYQRDVNIVIKQLTDTIASMTN